MEIVEHIKLILPTLLCRGRGYGCELMSATIEAAKCLKVHHIQFTSNPARVAANRLYQELGFM